MGGKITGQADAGKRGMPRDAVKYIAVFLMTLNHIGFIFLYNKGTGHDLLGLVFIGLGYFTAPTMLYLMADGIYYTRSIPKYVLRIGIFAVVSQLPYMFANSAPDGLRYDNLNFISTLLICVLMLWAFKAADENEDLKPAVGAVIKVLVFATAVYLSGFCDWAHKAPVYAAEFYFARKVLKNINTGWIFVVITHAVFIAASVLSARGVSAGRAALYFVTSMSGPVIAAILVGGFYKSGRHKKGGSKFGKWFFYIYYPAHLAILGGICYLLSA